MNEAILLRADRIVGMMPILRLSWLADQASSHQRIVEIGCWRGRTTRALCDATSGKVTAVDTWEGSPELYDDLNFYKTISGDSDWAYHEFLHNMEGTPNLEIVRKASLRAAEQLAKEGRTFDMIFLDGLHDYANVLADIRAWFPLLERDGMICGDDFQHPDVCHAVEDYFKQEMYDRQLNIWAVCKGGRK